MRDFMDFGQIIEPRGEIVCRCWEVRRALFGPFVLIIAIILAGIMVVDKLHLL